MKEAGIPGNQAFTAEKQSAEFADMRQVTKAALQRGLSGAVILRAWLADQK